MDHSLKQKTRELMTVTAEQERINTELELASSIQMDMLPRVFPPFPDRKEIDIYASMNPAKEVGGDFYDFFFIDENRLALVIADVSGKGIPAALFMMMVKIMVENCVLAGLGPKQAMEQVNQLTMQNNRESMFGKPEELVEYFKRHGISEIHYEQDIDKKDWVPKICASPMIIKGAGLLWGIK